MTKCKFKVGDRVYFRDDDPCKGFYPDGFVVASVSDYEHCFLIVNDEDEAFFANRFKDPVEMSEEQPKQQVAEAAGTKFDSGKLQFDLIPPYALEAVAQILTDNLQKYPDPGNWKKLPDAKNRFLNALMRHLNKHRKGIKFDTESVNPKTLHLAAVAANALFLLEMELNPEFQQ